MSPWMFHIRERGATPRIMQREHNNVYRLVAYQLAYYWWKEIRPLHFLNSASARYGYAPRSGERGRIGPKGFHASYTGMKLRRYGHTRPLVLTGESEQQTATNAQIHATATKGEARGRVSMRAPNLNYQNPVSRINPRDELTRTIPAEGEDIADRGRAGLASGYRQLSSSHTTTIS